MHKILLLAILGTLPTVAPAAGEHGSVHDTNGRHLLEGQAMPDRSKDIHASMAGQPGDPDKVVHTVEVSMDDRMRFVPDKISARTGETIRFLVRNVGRIQHEMVLGTSEELREHADMMRKMPGMHHVEPNTLSLGPGQYGDIVWRFDKAGTVDFACLVPGHMEAGMLGKVVVEN